MCCIKNILAIVEYLSLIMEADPALRWFVNYLKWDLNRCLVDESECFSLIVDTDPARSCFRILFGMWNCLSLVVGADPVMYYVVILFRLWNCIFYWSKMRWESVFNGAAVMFKLNGGCGSGYVLCCNFI